MEVTKKKRGIWAVVFGAGGAAAVACTACCISLSLLGPILAWLGITSLGAMVSG